MNEEKKKFYHALLAGGFFLLAIWLVFIVEWIFKLDLGFLGIEPRTLAGLDGIVFSPFVHGDFDHIQSNSPPVLVLTAGIFYFYRKIATKTMIWMWLMTGLWVWVGARSATHIGASGIVFGMASFVFFSGVFRRDPRAIALSLVVAFYYGGMIWGVLPSDPSVSFESHLFGAIAGLVLAFWFRREDKVEKKKYWWEDEPDNEPGDANAVWNYDRKELPPREYDEEGWKQKIDN